VPPQWIIWRGIAVRKLNRFEVVSTKKTASKKSQAPAAKPKNLGSATAAAILGHKPTKSAPNAARNGQVKIKAEWEKYYRTLLELRERLIAQRTGLA
jgi:hypothetical protein